MGGKRQVKAPLLQWTRNTRRMLFSSNAPCVGEVHALEHRSKMGCIAMTKTRILCRRLSILIAAACLVTVNLNVSAQMQASSRKASAAGPEASSAKIESAEPDQETLVKACRVFADRKGVYAVANGVSASVAKLGDGFLISCEVQSTRPQSSVYRFRLLKTGLKYREL